jgi:gas vesicle protein
MKSRERRKFIMSSEDNSSRVVWFLAGASIGAAIALLLAPASGKVTRHYLSRKTGEGRDALADAGRDIADKGREYYERGRKLAEEAGEMFEKGRKLVKG